MGQLVAFRNFIGELRAVWASVGDTEARMHAAQPLMERFVQHTDLRAASRKWPSTEPRKNLLFYEDPEFGFAINGVVRSPNYRGGIHDHAHAWVLYGLIDGCETLERFARLDDGSLAGYAELAKTAGTAGTRGRVDLIPAFGIHAEQGGSGRSAALIVRSERIAGRSLQNSYNLVERRVVAREAPEQIPFQL